MRYEVTVDPVDGEPFVFYVGDLEAGEVGSVLVAVVKRMEGEPDGWALHIRHLPAHPQGGLTGV